VTKARQRGPDSGVSPQLRAPAEMRDAIRAERDVQRRSGDDFSSRTGEETRLIRLKVEDDEHGACRVYEVRLDLDTGEEERLHVVTMHAVGTSSCRERLQGSAKRHGVVPRGCFDSRGASSSAGPQLASRKTRDTSRYAPPAPRRDTVRFRRGCASSAPGDRLVARPARQSAGARVSVNALFVRQLASMFSASSRSSR